MKTPAKTPRQSVDGMEVDWQEDEREPMDEAEEDDDNGDDDDDEHEDVGEEDKGDDENEGDMEEVHAKILVDDGPIQTPLQTPMKTPRRTPHKTPKQKKHKKRKRRQSQLDMAALTNEQAALAALESNQILHLRLRKRYYAEALNFIRQLEEAMPVLGQLLGSTNKAEVLEAMEFFRVAYEYQFDSAQVSHVRGISGS
jgi:condensin complex subunit 1